MLRIGLTGGIGSGKSTVASIFETLGIPVYYADEAAKRLMATDPAIRQALTHQFGADCFQDNKLNTAYIASLVFNDAEKLRWLNALIHPATIADAKLWMGEQHAPYTIREAALLFESNAHEGLDFVIGVSAPESLRIQRVISRDGSSETEIKRRMLGQWKEEDKIAKCDFVIHNDEKELLIPQVVELDKKLRALSTQQALA